jgi:hypothetical protein
MRIAEYGNYYVLLLPNDQTKRFRKDVWTRRDVEIFRDGYIAAYNSN